MAFSSFSQAVKDNTSSSSPTSREGPTLQEIQTSGIGLPAINGEVKLKITDPWPSDALPPPTSSLLAVASATGLLAAAGPNDLVLTSTDKIRAVLLEHHDKEKEKTPIRDFDPNLRIPRPRLSHVAFTADESALLVSAQDGGGIDAYNLRAIESGPAVSISTEGKALRLLVPNPAPEADLAPLVAVVTVDGELLIADLKTGGMRQAQNGPVLRSGVSCVAWSTKGKALVAGLADGTAVQLKPDGQEMALIPKLTTLEQNYYISNISWLTNDSFLFVYTSPGTEFPPDPCEYYIIDREPKTTNYTFKKFAEAPVQLMGKERLPTAHFIVRLKSFPPSLTELLLVSATSSAEVGILTKSDKALSAGAEITNDFTSTLIEDDGRRAVLPLGDDMEDTSPIGMAIDLSSSDNVRDPIPTNIDIEETSHAVPQLIVLNNDGLLCSWWIIYNDSVIEKSPYPGMLTETSAMETPKPTSEQPPGPTPAPAPTFAMPTSTFGQSAFGATAAKPSSPAFGTPSNAGPSSSTGFGPASTFGQSSTIGGAKSSWLTTGFGNNSTPQTTSSGPGQPSFGAPSAIGASSTPTFGGASALGKPAFGGSTAAPAFGSTGFGAKTSGFGSTQTMGSPFGASNPSGQSGFASFASGGAFGSKTAKDGEKPASPFGQQPSKGFGGFGQGSQDSPFGKPSSPFGQTASNGFAAANGSGSALNNAGAFKLDSSFKPDATSKDGNDSRGDSGFGFGTGFGNMLGSQPKVTSPTQDKEADMEDSDEQKELTAVAAESSQPQRQQPSTLVTPPSTIGQPKATPAPPVSNLFGNPSQQSTTPQPPPPASSSWSFGNIPSTTPKDAPAPAPMLFGQSAKPGPFSFGDASSQQATLQIKKESDSGEGVTNLKDIPEAPLPPDTTSKPRYVSGESDASSSNSRSTAPAADDPLPPDWVPANKSAGPKKEASSPTSPEQSPVEDAPLPPDPSQSRQNALSSEPSTLPSEEGDDFSEFDDSGHDDEDEDEDEQEEEDSVHVEAPTDDQEQIATSPESSFKSGERSTDLSPTGGVFTKVSSGAPKPRPLFGEVGTTGPLFPPPKPQESPRSPSPIRNTHPLDRLRSEASRSVSAPADRRSVIDQRKQTYAQSGLAAQAEQAQQQELARQKQQQDELQRRKLAAQSSELEDLEDDDDERLREELLSPINASEKLDQFVTYQAKPAEEGAKSGVPAQIERLYRDINCMVDTLGINSRSLGSFMKYQQEQEPNASWPQVLASETPTDALNDEWFLGDIMRLREGQTILDGMVETAHIDNVDGKILVCQELLSKDLIELKMKASSIRKTLGSRTKPEEAFAAPLSAEQLAVQQDLRKASSAVQNKLMEVEDALAILRTKVSGSSVGDNGRRLGGAATKKPTIEAVTNTVMKMTKMAEEKSADIDLLEAQLRKLGVNGSRQGTPNGTPNNRQLATASTPTSSVYHTPGSKFGGSTRSTPARSIQGQMPVISAEDRERWQERAARKKTVASLLRDVLQDRKKELAIKA